MTTTMLMMDAHADALRAQDEAWEAYKKANENGQRASSESFECRMKNTFACHYCDIDVEVATNELTVAIDEIYKATEKVTQLHQALLMDPEYIRWISKS